MSDSQTLDESPFLERRSGEDRRKAYDLDYFAQGGIERRKVVCDSQTFKDRRANQFLERRSGEDRRKTYDFDYFEQGGIERRKGLDRRRTYEPCDQY